MAIELCRSKNVGTGFIPVRRYFGTDRHKACPYIYKNKTKWIISIFLFFAIILAPSFASAQQGIITTVASTGIAGFSGDGGPATQAQLYFPADVALDSAGNIYIADSYNYRVRKVDTNGIIITVAGTGTYGFSGDGGPATQAQLYYPRGVAVDSAGSLYIAESFNHRVRRVDARDTITTVAGSGSTGFGGGGFSGDGGPATQALLDQPSGVAVDGAGNLYIADPVNQRVRRVDTRGIINTVAGTGTRGFSGDGGPATQAQLNWPNDVALDSAGNIYIADSYNYRVRRVDARGTITTVAGTGTRGFSGDGGPATQAQLDYPQGVAIDSAGNLYFADSGNNRVRKVDTSGIITTVAGTGIQGFSGDGGPATQAQLGSPSGIALDSAGNLYISDASNTRVRKVTFGPISPAPAPSPLLPPTALANGNPTQGTAPLTVRFTGQGSDPDGGSVVYFWDFGDGTAQSTQQNPSHTYQTEGSYTATLIVTDDEGQQARQSIIISARELIALVSIGVTPASPRLTAPGETVQLRAEGLYSNGGRADITSLVTWSSSNTAVASVSASGLVQAASSGSATITATSGGISGQATITVDIPRLISIRLEPSPVNIARVGERAQLTVTGVYSNGAEVDISGYAIYEMADPSIASISTTGRVTALGTGRTSITARVESFTEVAVLIVGEGGPTAPSRPTVPVSGIVRVKPQAIAAGFDPTLIDLNDDSFDIIAVVRPGAAPIRSVTVTQNQGQFSFRMNHTYTMSNGDQLWRATHNFLRGSIRGPFRALWGDRPGEFNVTVTDEGQQGHSFPNLEFGNTPALGFEVTSPWAGEGVEPVIRRVKPQVLAVGFSPTLIDVTDDSFDIIALVRQGAVPISGVTLTQNLGPFSISMNFLETLPNGDQLYKATFNFERGSIPNQIFRALWGDQPNEFNVTVIDQAQQQHSFPDLVFGNNPAIN